MKTFKIALVMTLAIFVAYCVFRTGIAHEHRAGAVLTPVAPQIMAPVDNIDRTARVLFRSDNPGYVVLGSPIDGGVASTPGSVDTTPGDGLNTRIPFSSAGTSGVISDGGSGQCGTFVGAIVSASSAGYWSLVQSAGGTIDAGGMGSAAVVPYAQLYVSGPQTLSLGMVAPGLLDGGAIWQASSTLGVITVDAGVPTMTGVVLCR